MTTQIFEQVKHILVERFAIKPVNVRPSVDLQKELGLDSMDAIDLLSAVNEAFEIRVPVELLDKIHTVSELVETIEKFGNAGGSRRAEY